MISYGNFFLFVIVVSLLSGWLSAWFLNEINNDTWNIFQKRGMHSIHLNINSPLSRRNEIRFTASLTNATVIGLSETNLDNTVLSSELEIEGYGLVKPDRSWRGGSVACFVKNSILYNRKPNFCINTESIFIEIFLPKFKLVLIDISYKSPDKYDFVNCLQRTFIDTNVIESQEYYLLGDININLQPKDKEIFRNKFANTISIRRHRSWFVWSRPDLLHKKEILTQIP